MLGKLKKFALGQQLKRMEKMSNAELEKIVEEAGSFVDAFGGTLELAGSTAATPGESPCTTSRGLDPAYGGIVYDGSWWQSEPFTKLEPAEKGKFWVADYFKPVPGPPISWPRWAPSPLMPKFNFAASAEDLDLHPDDFGMTLSKFCITFNLHMVNWYLDEPEEMGLVCPITHQRIGLSKIESLFGELLLSPASPGKTDPTLPSFSSKKGTKSMGSSGVFVIDDMRTSGLYLTESKS
jgi:hypothetical protein